MVFDLTGIASAVIAGVFSILAIVIPLWLASRMKDQQAAVVLGNAVKNSLGAIEQASQGQLVQLHPTVTIPGVSGPLAVGTQYVLDHAGGEAARFGITAEAIAAKVSAQIGLEKLAAKSVLVPIVTAPVAPPANPIPVSAFGSQTSANRGPTPPYPAPLVPRI